ncbi:MAG: hypothetical protein ACYDCQ_17105 [Dehalococcoidia bacterium]
MHREQIQQLRGLTLIVAVITLGISWSFALFHIHTAVYPLLWAIAMPPLAFYYCSGGFRIGTWKHLPAATLAIYAVVLWQISHKFGVFGAVSAAVGIIAATGAMWLGSRLPSRRPEAAAAPVPAPVPTGPRSRRARPRAQGVRR